MGVLIDHEQVTCQMIGVTSLEARQLTKLAPMEQETKLLLQDCQVHEHTVQHGSMKTTTFGYTEGLVLRRRPQARLN